MQNYAAIVLLAEFGLAWLSWSGTRQQVAHSHTFGYITSMLRDCGHFFPLQAGMKVPVRSEKRTPPPVQNDAKRLQQLLGVLQSGSTSTLSASQALFARMGPNK